jgi:CheY-like chemotaxis protein
MYGYEVLTARDGSEAVSIYEARKHDIHVVLCDMDMPSMDGRATSQALKRLNPEVNIILASGSSDRYMKDPDLIPGVRAFLQKPFTAEKLLVTLREILTKEAH